MGHLFTAGGKVVDGDGVRDLSMGSLTYVNKDVFPPSIDYLALGHLHIPQKVGGTEHIRYCGSPIPMGFGEAKQDKIIIMVEFNQAVPTTQEVKIPCFQSLERITGSLNDIITSIEQLKTNNSHAWLEVDYTGNDIVGNLRETLEEVLLNSNMEILRIKNRQYMNSVMSTMQADEILEDLSIGDVFERCMNASNIPDENRKELIDSYNTIIIKLQEEDKKAE